MSKSLAQLREQIAFLQREANQLENDVIARIRREVELHGITPEQLFGEPGFAPAERPTAKYADPAGNTWGGRGKRPKWLRTALESGRRLDEFLVKRDTAQQAE